MIDVQIVRNIIFVLLVFNTLYLRNSRNVTGVMSQILVILPPVTSYQPKTMPDNQ